MDLLTALLQVLEVANEGIHLVNEDGVTVIYNKAASEFDGLAPDEVIGRHLLDVFPSLTHDSSTLLRVLRNGVPEIARQQTFSNYKGKKITTINSTHPILVDGKIMGACEISTDITRIKEMAERISDLRKELRTKHSKSNLSSVRAREQDSILSRKLYTVDDIIGESLLIRDVKRRIFQVARGNSNVIVWGETGTGKELLVQSIHSASDRADFPFVPQNCAALPETLLESLVFGTSKGGFTGAQDRPGLLELASGGTLYLDEIDSMPLGLQAKLLRVIQEKRVRRLGDVRERPVDVRIIGSASVPPRHAVEHGILRADLYFRLAVVEIGLPPLRERREDIPLLCSHFLGKHSKRPKQMAISPQVMSAFLSYDWPGNVRELEHAIEGSLAFARDNTIELKHIPPSVKGVTAATWMLKTRSLDSPALDLGLGPKTEYDKSVTGTENAAVSDQASIRDELRMRERKAVEEALEHGGSISQAARILGIPRQTLQYRMKILDIAKPGGPRRSK
ncbi:MAG: sigma-54 interaction domain-containing protein [Bacillota bacterium]